MILAEIDGTLLAGLGTLLLGVVAVASLVLSVLATRKAKQALATSPAAALEGIRTQAEQVVATHQEAMERWQKQRDGLERALRHERDRADGAEFVALRLQSEVTAMRIDLAQARSEVAELRQRFDAAIGER